jgi:hypothetical protein
MRSSGSERRSLFQPVRPRDRLGNRRRGTEAGQRISKRILKRTSDGRNRKLRFGVVRLVSIFVEVLSDFYLGSSS